MASRERAAAREVALAQIRAAYAHSEFKAMTFAPRGIMADWMQDKDWCEQAEALRALSPNMLHEPLIR